MKARIRRLWFKGSPLWDAKKQIEYLYAKPLARFLQKRTVRYSQCDELDEFWDKAHVAPPRQRGQH